MRLWRLVFVLLVLLVLPGFVAVSHAGTSASQGSLAVYCGYSSPENYTGFAVCTSVYDVPTNQTLMWADSESSGCYSGNVSAYGCDLTISTYGYGSLNVTLFLGGASPLNVTMSGNETEVFEVAPVLQLVGPGASAQAASASSPGGSATMTMTYDWLTQTWFLSRARATVV